MYRLFGDWSWKHLLNLPWSQFSQRFLLKVQKCEVRICLESPLGTDLCIHFWLITDRWNLHPEVSFPWFDVTLRIANPCGKTTKHVRNTTWLTMKDMVCMSIDCIRFCVVWCTGLLWTESSTSWWMQISQSLHLITGVCLKALAPWCRDMSINPFFQGFDSIFVGPSVAWLCKSSKMVLSNMFYVEP